MIFRSWCLLAPGYILKIEARVQIGHLHYEVMRHRFYENESYMILPSKNA